MRVFTPFGALSWVLLPVAGFAQAAAGYGAAATPNVSAASTAMYSELGNVTGIGNSVLMTRVPVKSSTGVVSYHDITIQFDISANGTPSLTSGYPQFVLSPPLIINNFLAGNYLDSFGNKYLVAGPGVLSGGRTKWTLNWVPPVGKTGALDLTWATGPITGSPFQGTLNYWSITNPAYSRSVVGTSTGGTGGYPNPPFNAYYSNRAFGAWQTGNQLEIHNFASGGNVEISHLFLTRCAAAC